MSQKGQKWYSYLTVEEKMEKGTLIVIAIGGNSLIEEGNSVSVASQYEAARKTAHHIISLIAEGHKVVIAHGNGPQVGFALLRSENSKEILFSEPLDVCVANTQGTIGYQLQMALYNEAQKRNLSLQVATLITQVEVDPQDLSYQLPTKPIGSFMSQQEALENQKSKGWSVVEDSGRGYRRVVASPKPHSIVELDMVKHLVDANCVVITVGGGGIPVIRNSEGLLVGSEAVIDKDLAAALLAKELKADLFVISTAVDQVSLYYNTPNQQDLTTITAAEVEHYIEEGHFAPGSMLPKIEAALDFVKTTGNRALITSPANILNSLKGGSGTTIIG